MSWFSSQEAVRKTVSAFSRLQSIDSCNPDLTPENWCRVQPCKRIRVGGKELVITQPSSTVLVYALGILTAGVGIYFLVIWQGQMSRFWWGISLLLWGVGALLAGTSYQAFGFEIKCAGRQKCAWTSWWEVIYLMFQQVSMNTLLVAIAYSCTEGTVRLVLLLYAIACSALYVATTFVAALVPAKRFLTFNVMVWVSVPAFLICLFLNGCRYYQYHSPMDFSLLLTWVFLFITGALYWIYDELDFTTILWEKRKIWFSQNDMLHVCLILWAIYIGVIVASQVQDYSALSSSG